MATYNVKAVTCGHLHSIEENEICVPMFNKILTDPKKIRPYIAGQCDSAIFILILFDLFGRTIDELLLEIGSREKIIGAFICVDQLPCLSNPRTNVFYVSKSLLTKTIMVHAIHFCNTTSKSLCQSDRTDYHGRIMKEKSNNLSQLFSAIDKITACDILLIPLNVRDVDFRDLRRRMIEVCRDLSPDSEPQVRTIHDYMFDEFGSHLSNKERAFVAEQNKKICAVISKVAPIRFYVVGNEEEIPWRHSQLVMQYEPDNASQNTLVYEQWCHFIQCQPTTSDKMHNLVRDYGSSWQIRKIIPIEFETIRGDPHFLRALDHSRTTIRAREMIANVELSLWLKDYPDHSAKYSSEFQMIGEPQHLSTVQHRNMTEEINDRIRYDGMDSSHEENNQ